MSELDEIVSEFLVESYENLDRYDEDMLALERDPADTAVLASVFRTVHTIKGTCGFFGFQRLESVSHVAENLLGKLRDGELSLTQDMADALLATGDALRAMLKTACNISRLPQAQAGPQLGVARTTWQAWLNGSVPNQSDKFLSAVRRLEQAIGRRVYPEAAWLGVVHAAQEERDRKANAGRRDSAQAHMKVKVQEKDCPRSVSDHSESICLSVPDTVQGRKDEHETMNAFIKAGGAQRSDCGRIGPVVADQ
jgi:chemotaxis protein histidine kinase CheA